MNNLEKNIMDDVIKNPNVGRYVTAKKYGISEKLARNILKICKSIINEQEKNIIDPDERLPIYTAKLEKQKQRLMDQQRIERKIRNQIRVENCLSDYTNELINQLQETKFKTPIITHQEIDKNKTGVFCLSDLHLNELIDIPSNKYDFNIASKRLKKYVTESKKYFKSQNINNVLIVCLGDFLNSSRRMDELLNQATNLARATLLTAMLLEQVIIELNEDFNLSICGVTGNESRISDEYGSSEISMTNNHDYTVYEILKIMFKKSDIKFIGNNPVEQIVKINNNNILFLHGNQIGKGNVEKKIMEIKGKYADQDIIINYIVFGHIHSTMISDTYSRSSSLCGGNNYSNSDLQLSSRAAQLLLVISDKDINAIKIDLQYSDNYIGYDIEEKLVSYNVKNINDVKNTKIEIL
ncbi:hypothetical protein GW796_05990 [archaeon]|nr:hypothetical protein [archaeon]NCQ51435.1 hypothetical protein [archaeon]NCT58739.1 hypothetical protein [archaeon]